MPNQPTQDKPNDELREILQKLDSTKTSDNPDGNPFLPGNLSVDEAWQLIKAQEERALLEVKLKQLRLLDEVSSIGKVELDNTMYHLMVSGIKDWCKLTGKTPDELEAVLQSNQERKQ